MMMKKNLYGTKRGGIKGIMGKHSKVQELDAVERKWLGGVLLSALGEALVAAVEKNCGCERSVNSLLWRRDGKRIKAAKKQFLLRLALL